MRVRNPRGKNAVLDGQNPLLIFVLRVGVVYLQNGYLRLWEKFLRYSPGPPPVRGG